MATISTVKPAGGGDYSVWQSWENDADDALTADQWAEGYSGGDSGALTVAGWASTPNSSVYPRIYVAPGHGHGGAINQGVYLTTNSAAVGVRVEVPYTRVEGLRVMLTGTTVNGVLGVDLVDVTTEGLLIVSVSGTSPSRRGILFTRTSGFTSNQIQRAFTNIITVSDFASSTPYAQRISFSGGASMAAGQICEFQAINNTIDAVSSGSSSGIIMSGDGDASAERRFVLRNNVIARGTCYQLVAGSPITTTTVEHNASTDATADDWGGSGNLISQDRASMWQKPDSHDYRPKFLTSPLINAGDDVSGYGITTDILGAPRIQGVGTDIGAFESSAAPAVVHNSQVYFGRQVRTIGY